MAETELPVLRTPIALTEFVNSVVHEWPNAVAAIAAKDPNTAAIMGKVPTKGASAILFAQYMIETGGTSIFNFNIGNVKHVTGDGFNFHSLRNVFEGVSPAEADRLISSGQATADPSANHAAAVGPGRVSVLFNPPSPVTRFRAFGSLSEGMIEYLKLLGKRFAKAMPAAMAGDVDGFANSLKAQGYFTASAASYANGMRGSFQKAMNSTAFDDAVRLSTPLAAPVAIIAKSNVVSAVVIPVTLGAAAVGGLGYALFEWWKGRK